MLVGRALAAGLAVLFGYMVLAAIRRGRITPTRSDREYARANEPGRFWFHAAAYAVVTCAFLAGAIVRPRLQLLGFGALFAYFAINHVRIGRVKPSLHDRIYTRRDDPGTYWFHVLVEVIMAFALIAGAVLWRS